MVKKIRYKWGNWEWSGLFWYRDTFVGEVVEE